MSAHEENDISVNELIIAYVRDNRPLWDLRDRRYHDNNLKLNLWIDIGRALQIEVEVLKKKWKNLRDRFTKAMHDEKSKSGQAATKKKEWPLFSSLEFLRDTIKPRKTTDSFTVQQEDSQLEDSNSGNDHNTTTISSLDFDVGLAETVQNGIIEGVADSYVENDPFKLPETASPTAQIPLRSCTTRLPAAVPLLSLATQPTIITSLQSQSSAVPSPPLTIRIPIPSPPLTIRPPTPSPPTPSTSPAPSSASSGDTSVTKKFKKNDNKSDPVDAAVVKFLQQRAVERSTANQPTNKKEDLSADEHFYMHVAKEAQNLSKVRRMRLRHAVSAKLLEFLEEEEMDQS